SKHYKSGKIIILRSQSIRYPRSHARSPKSRTSRVQEQLCRSMIELAGVNSFYHRQFIGNIRHVWKEIGNPVPTLSTLFENSLWSQHLRHAADESKSLSFQKRSGTKLAIQFFQFRLVVKQFEL